MRAIPLASIRAYRRTGCAPHRYRISLRRYARLREWTLTAAARRWRTSGAWLRGSLTVSLWPQGGCRPQGRA